MAVPGLFRFWRLPCRAFLKTSVPTPVVTVLGKAFGRQYNRQIAPIWRNVS